MKNACLFDCIKNFEYSYRDKVDKAENPYLQLCRQHSTERKILKILLPNMLGGGYTVNEVDKRRTKKVKVGQEGKTNKLS